MVTDAKTLQPLHPLSKEGEKVYREFIEEKADELILKSSHPFLHLIYRIFGFLGLYSETIDRRYSQVLQEIRENRM